MNKSGFTLVELIVTIGLMVLLGLVIVSNLSSNLTKEQDKQYELFKSTLENAACTYIELSTNKSLKNTCKSSGCNVSIGDLYDNQLIQDEDLKNPKTDEGINLTKVIKITYVDGVKTCVYQE